MGKYIPDTHILWSEYTCNHCGALPPYFEHYNNWLQIPNKNQQLFTAFEMYRSQMGEGRVISSGYRCPLHQERLYKENKSSALISVHEFGYALDVKCKGAKDMESSVRVLKSLPISLRIGWQGYLRKHESAPDEHPPFIHFDIGHMIDPIYSKHLKEGAEW